MVECLYFTVLPWSVSKTAVKATCRMITDITSIVCVTFSLSQEVLCIGHPLINYGQNYNILCHAQNYRTLHLQ